MHSLESMLSDGELSILVLLLFQADSACSIFLSAQHATYYITCSRGGAAKLRFALLRERKKGTLRSSRAKRDAYPTAEVDD